MHRIWVDDTEFRWTERQPQQHDNRDRSNVIGGSSNSEEKREPANDIDTAIVDGMKALDPDRPIREADMCANPVSVSSRIGRIRGAVSLRLTVADLRL